MKFLIDRPSHGWDLIEASGRLAEVLNALLEAADRGVTAKDFAPGVRLAAHVHRLKQLGAPIERRTERHGGPHAGSHARYILGRRVRLVCETGRAAEPAEG